MYGRFPWFGNAVFKLDRHIEGNRRLSLTISINGDGIHFLHRSLRSQVALFRLSDIIGWYSTATRFSFTARGGQRQTFATSEGADICKLLSAHATLMGLRQGVNIQKSVYLEQGASRDAGAADIDEAEDEGDAANRVLRQQLEEMERENKKLREKLAGAA